MMHRPDDTTTHEDTLGMRDDDAERATPAAAPAEARTPAELLKLIRAMVEAANARDSRQD